MSKYIIELNDDCNMVLQICITEHGSTYIESAYAENLEELNSDYIKENCKSLLNAEYQRGFEDGKAVNDNGCEGCRYECENKRRVPCILCSNNFKLPCTISSSKLTSQWTAKSPMDDGFVRGDVVVDENRIKGIVVSSDNDEDYYFYVLYDGCQVPQRVTQRYYKKTGEHYDIDKYLKEINRSKTDDIC